MKREIALAKKHYELIVEHSQTALPNEACGLVGGVIDGDGSKRAMRIYPLTNTDHSPEHFSMDPAEQFQAIKDMRKNGWKLLGNFHSHPASPSRPSEEDKRLAFDSVASYLILSLENRQAPILKSFHIETGVVGEENIILQEE